VCAQLFEFGSKKVLSSGPAQNEEGSKNKNVLTSIMMRESRNSARRPESNLANQLAMGYLLASQTNKEAHACAKWNCGPIP
jgi:hypothetical protein